MCILPALEMHAQYSIPRATAIGKVRFGWNAGRYGSCGRERSKAERRGPPNTDCCVQSHSSMSDIHPTARGEAVMMLDHDIILMIYTI